MEKEEPLFDNLYLDMNGIMHPCCHPEEGPPPRNEAEMFNAVFAYTDKLMRIVRPKKLLYIAIDGVAPRAKMNQQRSRRFRTSIEGKVKSEKEEQLRMIWEAKGEYKGDFSSIKGTCISIINFSLRFQCNNPGDTFHG